jgi:glucose 1-dehydrogenase
VPQFPQRLAGRHALVTGGSRGIGKAVAIRFAQEGAVVAINHRNDPDAARETLEALNAATAQAGLPQAAHRIEVGDVSKEQDLEAMFAALVSAWGRVDILVNNAGVQSETPGDTMTAEDIGRIIAVNLEGPAMASRIAIRHFLGRPGGGVILNTSSVHEVIPKPGYAAYAMSKAGLGHLTRTLALEFADKGVRVNAIGPGATVTAMNDAWRDDPQKRRAVESHIPMGFAADPEDMAPAYAFLASDEARYITGQSLFIDGGLTLYPDFKHNWSS